MESIWPIVVGMARFCVKKMDVFHRCMPWLVGWGSSWWEGGKLLSGN